MHNLISHNQMEGWKQNVLKLERTIDKSIDNCDLLNDYYDCLIECDDKQSICKRVCRRMLS
jgi:hypothetical protein